MLSSPSFAPLPLLPFPYPTTTQFGIVFLRYVLTIFYNIFDRCDLLRSPARLSIFPLFPFRASCVWEKLIETLLSTEPQTLRSQATGKRGGAPSLPASLSHCLKLSAGDQRPTSWQTLEFPPHDHSAKWSRVALCSLPLPVPVPQPLFGLPVCHATLYDRAADTHTEINSFDMPFLDH